MILLDNSLTLWENKFLDIIKGILHVFGPMGMNPRESRFNELKLIGKDTFPVLVYSLKVFFVDYEELAVCIRQYSFCSIFIWNQSKFSKSLWSWQLPNLSPILRYQLLQQVWCKILNNTLAFFIFLGKFLL